MYANGKGLAKNYVHAHMWSNLSARNGDAEAVEQRNFFESKMTPQQVALAQKLARECQARNFKNCD
jgi:TPR repeat protein